jgi:hypothetical protein
VTERTALAHRTAGLPLAAVGLEIVRPGACEVATTVYEYRPTTMS